MVYCEYIKNTDKAVTYSYGQTIYDMTGEVEYDFNNDILTITKKPEKYSVVTRQIESLFRKHRDEFCNGKFREKIAFEA
ncbi:MAG: hypothetical protein ACOYJI_06390 [Anaerovoracaceae bacterium]|jgi:hypothetical protein